MLATQPQPESLAETPTRPETGTTSDEAGPPSTGMIRRGPLLPTPGEGVHSGPSDPRTTGPWRRRYVKGVGTSYENTETGERQDDPPQGLFEPLQPADIDGSVGGRSGAGMDAVSVTSPTGVWRKKYLKGVGDYYENVDTGETRRDRHSIPEGHRVLTRDEVDALDAERLRLEAEQKERDSGPQETII